MNRISTLIAGLMTVGVVASPVDAQAYLDAGSGSLLLQVFIAGICTVALFFNQLKNWIFKGFRK